MVSIPISPGGASRDLYFNLHERKDGNALLSAANDLDRLSHGMDVAGDKTRHFTDDVHRLNHDIEISRQRVHELHLEFARTRDVSLFGDINKEEQNLRRLMRTARSIASDIGGAGGGVFKGSDIASGDFSQMAAESRGMIIAGVVTAVAVAAPAIGAMLAGAVAGAVGTGGLAAGLLSAAKSDTVQAAAHTFGQNIADEFFRGGAAFERPAIQAMHTIEQAFKDMHVPEALAKLAPTVDTIADGFAKLGTNFMPGFNRALDRMGPYAEVAGEGLADIGSSLGQFLDDVTKSPGALMGLDALFKLINGTVVALGKGIKLLSDEFGFAVMMGEKVTGLLAKIPGYGKLYEPIHAFLQNMMAEANNADPAERFSNIVTEVHNLGDAFIDTARANNIFNDAMERAYGNALDFLGAQISVEEALDRFAEGVREHGKTMDIDTEAGRENLENLKRIAETGAEAAKQKLIETGNVADANKVYEYYRQKLYDVARELGFTKDQAQQLADKWLALEALPDIDKKFTIRRYTLGPSNATFGGGLQEFASGGYVMGPAHSPQLAVVHAGERVLTEQQQRDYAMAMSGMGGGSTQVNISWAATGDPFLDVLVRELRRFIRVEGGTGSDSVQVAFGQN